MGGGPCGLPVMEQTIRLAQSRVAAKRGALQVISGSEPPLVLLCPILFHPCFSIFSPKHLPSCTYLSYVLLRRSRCVVKLYCLFYLLAVTPGSQIWLHLTEGQICRNLTLLSALRGGAASRILGIMRSEMRWLVRAL